jgi:hypothetical protein
MISEWTREAYEKKREAWALKKQGLSYAQIAKRLDISPSEVLYRLYGYRNPGLSTGSGSSGPRLLPGALRAATTVRSGGRI